MGRLIVCVQIHLPEEGDEKELGAAMEKQGFKRLPATVGANASRNLIAEFELEGDCQNSDLIFQRAKMAASRFGRRYRIIQATRELMDSYGLRAR